MRQAYIDVSLTTAVMVNITIICETEVDVDEFHVDLDSKDLHRASRNDDGTCNCALVLQTDYAW